jgi:hypothetical protein
LAEVFGGLGRPSDPVGVAGCAPLAVEGADVDDGRVGGVMFTYTTVFELASICYMSETYSYV